MGATSSTGLSVAPQFMLGLDSKGEVWDYGCTGWGHPVLLLAESLSRSPCLHLEGGQLIVEGAPLNPSSGPQGGRAECWSYWGAGQLGLNREGIFSFGRCFLPWPLLTPCCLCPQSSCISFTYWKETVSILLSPDRTSPCAIVSYIDEAYMDIDRDFSEE